MFAPDESARILILETPSGALPIAWSNAPVDEVALITDTEDGEYGRPFTFDLGRTPSMAAARIPAGTCSGVLAWYEQYVIPEGAAVELVGCVRAGRIEACTGELGGVLARPALAEDLRHRTAKVMSNLRIALVIILVFLGLAGLVLFAWTRDSLLLFRQRKT